MGSMRPQSIGGSRQFELGDEVVELEKGSVVRVQGAPGVAYVDDANRVTFHYAGATIVMRNNCNHDIARRSP
jgi:hypothetical protein